MKLLEAGENYIIRRFIISIPYQVLTALKMEAAGSSVTLITTYMIIRCCNSEDDSLNLHRRQNLTSGIQ
jgi:hypothetical protein